MATYAATNVGPAFVALPAPTADAWVQPTGGDIFLTTDAVPSTETALIVENGSPFPVSAGTVLHVASTSNVGVLVRKMDAA